MVFFAVLDYSDLMQMIGVSFKLDFSQSNSRTLSSTQQSSANRRVLVSVVVVATVLMVVESRTVHLLLIRLTLAAQCEEASTEKMPLVRNIRAPFEMFVFIGFTFGPTITFVYCILCVA